MKDLFIYNINKYNRGDLVSKLVNTNTPTGITSADRLLKLLDTDANIIIYATLKDNLDYDVMVIDLDIQAEGQDLTSDMLLKLLIEEQSAYDNVACTDADELIYMMDTKGGGMLC